MIKSNESGKSNHIILQLPESHNGGAGEGTRTLDNLLGRQEL